MHLHSIQILTAFGGTVKTIAQGDLKYVLYPQTKSRAECSLEITEELQIGSQYVYYCILHSQKRDVSIPLQGWFLFLVFITNGQRLDCHLKWVLIVILTQLCISLMMALILSSECSFLNTNIRQDCNKNIT